MSTPWSEASRGFGGKIADFPLTSVLQILELGKKSGFLYIRSFPKIAFLVFREGSIIQAVSTLRRVGLGELLIAEGFISKDDLTSALEVQRRAPKKKMLGEIFETLGHITHAQIIELLTRQMKEIVRWTLEWKEGDFTFYAGSHARASAQDEAEEMSLPVGIVVQEVLQSMLSEKDRRRHPRVPISLKVVHQTDSGREILYTRDVSAGGLYVLAPRLPKKGEELNLEVWIPTLIEPTPTRCKVIRLHDKDDEDVRGYAVEFVHIDEDARSILERLGGALSPLL